MDNWTQVLFLWRANLGFSDEYTLPSFPTARRLAHMRFFDDFGKPAQEQPWAYSLMMHEAARLACE